MSRSPSSAEAALVAYGYAKDEASGMFTRGDTQAWRKTDEGWERFDPPSLKKPIRAEGVDDPADGASWGLPTEVGWVRVPYKLGERWRNISGAHPATHPECFEWLWPEEEVAELYLLAKAANTPEGNPFVRIDGVLVHKDDIEE